MPDVVLLKKFSYLSAVDFAMSIPYNDERRNEISKSGKLWKNTSFTPVHNFTQYIMTHLKHIPELRFFWLCHRIYINMITSVIILYCENIRGVGMEWKCGPNKHKVEELMSALPRSECLDVIILGSNTDFAKF
jgi:hypothetical protein